MSPPHGSGLFNYSWYVHSHFPSKSTYHFLATSVDVERTFSQGRLVLSHVRSRLSVQSTRVLLCLGVWSEMGYVKDKDILAVAALPEILGEEVALSEDWDKM